MYDDISTFKKKANLANFNFRPISYNDDTVKSEGDPLASVSLSTTQNGDGQPEIHRHRQAEVLSLGGLDAEGSGTGQARGEGQVSPPTNCASFAPVHDIMAGVRAAMDIPGSEAVRQQGENDGFIQNEIPLFSLFKSISSKE